MTIYALSVFLCEQTALKPKKRFLTSIKELTYMGRFSQIFKIGLALFLAVFGNGLLPVAQAYAYSETNPGGVYKKVYVCKYVGTPGEDETLQTGDNPISVSENAIPADPVVVGSYFADQQGRSYVVAWDNGDKIEPPLSMCPAPDGPDSIAVPATPSVTDPCGVANATWVVPADTDEIDWTLEGDGDLVAETKDGFIFANQTTSHNYGKAVIVVCSAKSLPMFVSTLTASS